MLKTLRRRLNRDEGFTLIELMVVVLIIAILIAIAIPSFLSFRASAQDRSAQSDLRTVLLTQNAIQLETGVFTEATADILAFEANARVHATDPAEGVVSSVAEGTGHLCLIRTSDSGRSFGVFQELNGPTVYGEGPDCSGAAGWSNTGW
jgi:type IV pilus assembly protein PilA